ncbi:ABC transporter ATP-binding protein [Persicobacter sp. CCB-QB2]|uniref:ABC transporter ATP-binding protein n=1 Tax=Persicobacter sp. CCB-QB2 TaxID=1561025 RepID=UPI0006A946C6|nr:ABC transporter ATP-binding protein [Persicobacter sp. CCB-QB2]
MINQIEIEQVNKRFADHQALTDLSLTVPKGSIFGLLGPNGAGKSTLIRIINQIIFADSGTIRFNQQELQPDHIRRIGYLPEERGLYKKMKVGEQLLYLARLKGLSKRDAIQKIRIWFDKFEIADWSNKKVEDLSKGMAQKVQFISTVMHEPEFLILDEPFSGFDPVNANLIRDEILALRDKGCTVMLSTHRMESVEELCDNIALINKSEKVLEGKKRDIKMDHKANKYQIVTDAMIDPAIIPFELINSHQEDYGHFNMTFQLAEGENSNDLLSAVFQQGHVVHFEELIPSMSEIFIQHVSKVEGPASSEIISS